VVLLILGSLSNVVGYQSVKTNTVNDSPLFKTRTQRATNQERNIIKPQYLGKGNQWQFPMGDNRTEQLKKVISIINKMDEKTFNRFVVKIKILLSQQDETKDIDINDIEKVLHQLKRNSEVFLIYIRDNSESMSYFDTPSACWFPGCIIGAILIFIMTIYILVFLPTSMVRCYFPSIDICQ